MPMQLLIVGCVALLAGIAVGFLLRAISAKSEKALLQQQFAAQAQQWKDQETKLATAATELARTREESAARAGFESLATERAVTIASLTVERDRLQAELKAQHAANAASAARIAELQAQLENEKSNLAEKVALLDSARQALASQFETLAGKILDEKSKSFSEGNQKELGSLLAPLREQIKEFREKVEQAQLDSKLGVTKLETLVGDLSGLNQQLSKEAHNLSTALLGSTSDQGNWGQKIARDLLVLGGLHEGIQFKEQQTLYPSTEDDVTRRSFRPDIVVTLPGGRNLIVDSKVSLNAYYLSTTAGSEKERKEALKNHLSSVRKHIDDLSSKNYHKLQTIESPDFVVMFVPIEPAFLAAIHADGELWQYAYEKQVLLVGPTTLLFVIRIVDNLWRQEQQTRSVKEITKRGTALYEKFVGFVADLEALGKNLRIASESYEDARSKLTSGPGNLIRQVEMLKKLVNKTSKALPNSILDIAELGDESVELEPSQESITKPEE